MYLRVLEAAVLEPPESTTEIERTRITHTINHPVVAPVLQWCDDHRVPRQVVHLSPPGRISD
eukprot:COSAG06_NODE_29366_length_558_cov_0.485839_1_plen_61_part_10